MKNCPSMSAPPPRPRGKSTLVMAIALFLITTSLLVCATSSELFAGASHRPSITIYVGSG
ncbi:hypothetical protein [Geobacter sp. AOG1]|uniref:hypothetical protein n=1 Tax=Geobacter sp. AOG1 TaxID=1566346 RepID=UPI001CC5B994|nr:hypothetical protein AOG1_15710 [Geobacter sp. AOG1]